MRRSRGSQRVMHVDRQCQGVALKGFRLDLFLMLLCLQGVAQVKAMETSSIHLEKEMEVEADRFAPRQNRDESRDTQERSRSPWQQQQQQPPQGYLLP